MYNLFIIFYFWNKGNWFWPFSTHCEPVCRQGTIYGNVIYIRMPVIPLRMPVILGGEARSHLTRCISSKGDSKLHWKKQENCRGSRVVYTLKISHRYPKWPNVRGDILFPYHSCVASTLDFGCVIIFKSCVADLAIILLHCSRNQQTRVGEIFGTMWDKFTEHITTDESWKPFLKELLLM